MKENDAEVPCTFPVMVVCEDEGCKRSSTFAAGSDVSSLYSPKVGGCNMLSSSFLFFLPFFFSLFLLPMKEMLTRSTAMLMTLRGAT